MPQRIPTADSRKWIGKTDASHALTFSVIWRCNDVSTQAHRTRPGAFSRPPLKAQRPASLPSQPASGGGGEQALSALQARRVSAPPAAPQAGTYFDLKTRVQNRLLAELDPSMDITKTEEVRRTILNCSSRFWRKRTSSSRARSVSVCSTRLWRKFSASGPIQPLLEDDTISEIMVNGPKNIYVERKGKIVRVPITFESNDHVMRVIDRIVPAGPPH